MPSPQYVLLIILLSKEISMLYKNCFNLVSVASSPFTINSLQEQWKALIVSFYPTHWLLNRLEPINLAVTRSIAAGSVASFHKKAVTAQKLILGCFWKPRQHHSKAAVSHRDTSIWPNSERDEPTVRCTFISADVPRRTDVMQWMLICSTLEPRQSAGEVFRRRFRGTSKGRLGEDWTYYLWLGPLFNLFLFHLMTPCYWWTLHSYTVKPDEKLSRKENYVAPTIRTDTIYNHAYQTEVTQRSLFIRNTCGV